MKTLFRTLIVLTLLSFSAFGAPVQTGVSYVAASSIYLSAGRTAGLQKGDSAIVYRQDQPVGRALIVFVADSSASAQIISSDSPLRVGDAVTVFCRDMAATPIGADSVAKFESNPAQPTATTTMTKAKPRRREAFVSGRVGAQLYGQNGRDDYNTDYVQPALTLRLRAERLFNSPLSVSVRARARNIDRKASATRNASREWDNRVYELAVSYRDPESRLGFEAGRLISNRLCGMGSLDGYLLNVRANSDLTAGTFGGFRPDLRSSDLNTHETRVGVFATFERGSYQTRLISATLAAAGEYTRGEISREFLYQQVNLTSGSIWSLFESAEININRGWRKQQEGGSLSLSNLLLNLRYAPHRNWAFSTGYDNRTPYRTWETRTLADSLFDTSLQQGWSAGVDSRLPLGIRADVRGTLRATHGEDHTSRSLSCGLGHPNMLRRGVSASLRLTTFTNRFSNGMQPSLSLSRSIGRRLNAGLDLGQDHYTLKNPGQTQDANWGRLRADAAIGRAYYASAYYEIYRGEAFSADRFFVELGVRL